MISWLPLTIREQDLLLRKKWNTFRAVEFEPDLERIVWRGTLHPRFSQYTVEIEYSMGMVVDGPKVRVKSPELIRQPGNAEGSLPHVYQRDTDPYLCLFDPRKVEWTGWMAVADTTVPWIINWLTCYEDWLLTGEWHGGGRHVTAAAGSLFNLEHLA